MAPAPAVVRAGVLFLQLAAVAVLIDTARPWFDILI